MAVQFAAVNNLVTSLLNASTIYGTNDDIERHPPAEIADAISGADAQVSNAILMTPGHPQRINYLVVKTYAYGATLDKHIGPIGAVKVGGKIAQPRAAGEIQHIVDDATITQRGPYYDIVGDDIFFVGATTTASVDLYQYTGSGMTLQSPDEMFNAVVALALAYLFGKEGAEVQAAEHYKALAESYMQMIQAGAQKIPPIIEYQQI